MKEVTPTTAFRGVLRHLVWDELYSKLQAHTTPHPVGSGPNLHGGRARSTPGGTGPSDPTSLALSRLQEYRAACLSATAADHRLTFLTTLGVFRKEESICEECENLFNS